MPIKNWKFTAIIDMSLEELELIRILSFQERMCGYIKISLTEIVAKTDTRLCLTKRKVHSTLQKLEKNGIISVTNKGVKGKPTTYEILI